MINSKKSILIFIFIVIQTLLYADCSFSADFEEKLKNLKWIAYSPTNYSPEKNIYPTEDSIKEDLKVLYQYGFNGLVTYSSAGIFSEIPRFAKEAGFEGVITGVWDIENREEIIDATLAVNYTDAYCMGNEGLNRRYDFGALEKAIISMKRATGKPVSFTEEVFDYGRDEVLTLGDWIFPNIHPFACEIKDPEKGVNWVKKHYQFLEKKNRLGRPIIFKETGFPTRGSRGASATNQKKYFELLKNSGVPFVYFEAFDQTWKKSSPYEPYWGLFDSNRYPKKFISGFKLKK